MNAELISVGTEILLGEILNTDAKFLSERLSSLGINVYYQTVVGDNKIRLAQSLKDALSRADAVIVSGGLGPTPDDLTKETIAEVTDETLVLDTDSMKAIEDYFAKTGREMPKSNIKQAMMPKNCIILKNNNGTAPGCIIEKNGKIVVMLPGPPNELEPMFKESVEPYLRKKTGGTLYSHTFKLFGIGEAKVAEIFRDMMEKGENPTLAPYAETAGVRLRLASYAENKEEAEKIISEARKRIISEVGEYIYSEEDKTLPETVVEILAERKMTVSAGESCTGGMFAKMIVDVPGCSAILNESFVTYSNEAKRKYLGVKKETLDKYGAVSEDVAKEMAEGAAKNTGADIGVGITGIAGPDGGSEEKPVGLVYAAVCINGEMEVRRLNLCGNREKVRYSSALNAFDMIFKRLK